MALAFVFSGHVWAQEQRDGIASPDDWANVTALASGSYVRIELASGQRVTGHLTSAVADGVILSVEGTNRTMPRPMIRRVVLLGVRLTARQAKKGFIIGAIAGGVVGSLATKGNRIAWGAFLAGSWGAIGAIVGAIDGSSHRVESVVYTGQLDSR